MHTILLLNLFHKILELGQKHTSSVVVMEVVPGLSSTLTQVSQVLPQQSHLSLGGLTLVWCHMSSLSVNDSRLLQYFSRSVLGVITKSEHVNLSWSWGWSVVVFAASTSASNTFCTHGATPAFPILIPHKFNEKRIVDSAAHDTMMRLGHSLMRHDL